MTARELLRAVEGLTLQAEQIQQRVLLENAGESHDDAAGGMSVELALLAGQLAAIVAALENLVCTHGTDTEPPPPSFEDDDEKGTH